MKVQQGNGSDHTGSDIKTECQWSLTVGILTLPSSETVDMKPEEGSGGEFIDINQEGGYDGKDEAVPEEVTVGKKRHSH